jgi:hypothetical protein
MRFERRGADRPIRKTESRDNNRSPDEPFK